MLDALPRAVRPPARGGRGAFFLLPACVAAAAGTGAVVGLLAGATSGRQLALAIAGLLLASLLFAVGLWRPAALALLSFVLLPFVRREPAPVDVAAAMVIFAVLLTPTAKVKVHAAIGLAVAAFVTATLVSVTNVNDLARAVQYEWITLYLIGFALCLSAVLTREATARRCIEIYILGAAASAAAGTAALFVSFPGSSTLLYDPNRTMALFKDPNVFSGFLVPAIAILVDELASRRLLQWRWATKVVLLAMLSAGLLFAFSRAAWLNAAVALAVLAVVRLAQAGALRYAVRALLGLAVVGASGYALLVLTHSTAFLESRSRIQNYDQQRFATQSRALRDATVHVFGFGPGQVEVNLPLASHSLYARVAYEQGLPGLLTLVVLFLLTLWAAIAVVGRPSPTGVGGAALLASWCGLLANSFFIDTLHWRHLWIVAALIWTSYAWKPDRAPSRPPLTGRSPATRRA